MKPYEQQNMPIKTGWLLDLGTDLKISG